jgi:hypothetical protein
VTVLPEEIGETRRRVARRRVARRVDVVVDRAALRVDEADVGVAGHERRVGVERVDAAREVLGRMQVVVRGPFEVLAGRQLGGPVEVAAGADVAGVAMIADAPVPGGVAPADVAGGVGGGVVADDQLEVGERLDEERFDGVAQVASTVEDGKTDTDLRRERSRLRT